jgi:hypothetical protein
MEMGDVKAVVLVIRGVRASRAKTKERRGEAVRGIS